MHVKFTIVYPPTIDYEYMRQRPQHLMQHFARAGHQVYYMQLSADDRPPQQIEPNLTVVHRPDDIMQLKRSHPLVLWMSWSRTHPWVERLRPHIAVYDCLDDFPEFRAAENEIVRKVDLVTATSDRLYHKMRERHRRVVLVRNACDFDHFSVDRPALPRDWPPPGLEHGPVVGYSGALGYWLDRPLLERIAEHYQVVLIGPWFGMQRTPHPRIHCLGLRDYTELPQYLHQMDALIIPFHRTDLTDATNPIKMYEYLATGVPVVSTAIPEAVRQAGVMIGETHQSFVAHLHRAVRGLYSNPQLVAARRRIARDNSWQNRYDRISQALLSTHMKKRSPRRRSLGEHGGPARKGWTR